jgi:hypothetical protein
MRRAKAISGEGQLSVGIHPREGRFRYGSGVTVSQVARWHEIGTRRMPARPFLTYWWTRENGARRIRDATRKALELSLTRGTDPLRALQQAGERYVAQIQSTFQLMRPIKISTARRKRSSEVLVESGMMWRSIGYRARVGGRQAG